MVQSLMIIKLLGKCLNHILRDVIKRSNNLALVIKKQNFNRIMNVMLRPFPSILFFVDLQFLIN